MPFIADNIIVFLFRVILLAYRGAQCASWTKIEGMIKTSAAPEKEMYPFALITYAYKVNFERYSGKYKRGFWYNDSAQHFAQRFVPGEHLAVRVDPTNPEKSYILEQDQIWWKKRASIRS